MDLDLTMKGLSLLMSIVAIGYAWFATRRKDVDRRIEAADRRADRHENRTTQIEALIKTMPDRNDTHALQLGMSEMTGSLREIRAVMEGNAKIMARLETIVTRHEDHLLAGGKR